jgi:hypothetical protein
VDLGGTAGFPWKSSSSADRNMILRHVARLLRDRQQPLHRVDKQVAIHFPREFLRGSWPLSQRPVYVPKTFRRRPF